MSCDDEPVILDELDDTLLESEEYEEDLSWRQHTIDDTLDFATKFERYHMSDIASQRLILLQDFGDNLQDLGVRVVIERLLPLFMKFATDGIPAVRKEFLIQLKSMALLFIQSEREDARLEVFQTLIPPCFDLTVDDNEEVSSSAVDAVVEISTVLQDSELEESIFQIINLYAHDDRDEECRIVAIRIYNRLASRFNVHQIGLVVSELTNLGDDMSCYVRCAVARNLNNVMVAIGPVQAYESMFPVFRDLCRDEISDVRIACAESFLRVIRTIDHTTHAKEISDYLTFLLDSEYSVRKATLRFLGEYITLLPRELITSDLVQRFAEIPMYDEMNSLSESCAQSLLAVLKAIGPHRWDELSVCFSLLYQHIEVRVKRCVAEQLHLIATQFHPDISHKLFSPVFEYFLEAEDLVKIDTVGSASLLLERFPEPTREGCVLRITDTLKSTQNWRVRQAVGEALRSLLHLCTPSFRFNVITSIGLKMLRDSVASVRRTGAALVASCVEALTAIHYEIDFVIDQVGCLAGASHYAHRILFVIVAEKIHDASPLLFHTHFLQKLTQLSSDSVPNVRIRVAKLLVSVSLKGEKNALCDSCLEKLHSDSDVDVRSCVPLSVLHIENKNSGVVAVPNVTEQEK